MRIEELQYQYPEDLVATHPQRPSRILLSDDNQCSEITLEELKALIQPGDLFVINDTKVEPRRVFAKSESGEPLEILFVSQQEPLRWSVLFPTKRLKKNEKILFPNGLRASLVQGGRPQTLEFECELDAYFFSQYGEMPLPPYIQKARGSRHTIENDSGWYQTDWAEKEGSSAAPTASFHFTKTDLFDLRNKGVFVETLTLHVGLGTYLPVTAEDLNHHQMHEEDVFIPRPLIERIENVKSMGKKIWALGTTTTRALESLALQKLEKTSEGHYQGRTDLLIQEGFQFQMVDGLLTNFHQPESTLLALVMGFAGKARVLEAYKFAMEKRFRLFSYGDLSVWLKN